MLYERWRRIAAERRNELALREPSSGSRITFGELYAAAEAIKVGQNDFVFPQGHSLEFVLAVLAAWRAGKVVCPLESGQPPPRVAKPPPPSLDFAATFEGAANLVR